ncbi:OmpA family protein [Thalassotalea sp. PLHSN55]|uniref:MotY family protein n=1 Tax=Thalassotalea sp. PLHSN55 TaxID=3435888 RepID=UPI003F832964
MKTAFFNIRKLTTTTLVFFSVFSQAMPLMTPLDQVTWQQQGSSFSCKLTTNVSDFGEVSLIKNAGYAMEIVFDSVLYSQAIDQVAVGFSPAPWSQKQLPQPTWYSVSQQNNVEQLLQQLQRGNWGRIQLNYQPNNSHETLVQLVLPTVQRGENFQQYFQCLSELSPLSYDQVRDRNFYFAVNELLLNQQQQQQLTDIVRFIELEPKVSRILVDGHADSSGHASENLRLSQLRADDVYAYLLEAGVDPAIIEVRSHGDRYPVNNNADAAQREKNRRVNLRIILNKGS